MKKILAVILVVLVVSCKEEVKKDYVTLSGKIENATVKELKIANRALSKLISINDDGTFSDTLKVEKGFFSIINGNNRAVVFLANNYDLKINADATNFLKTISFDGKGDVNNKYITEKMLYTQENIKSPKDFFELETTDYNSKVANLKTELAGFLTKYENLDSLLVSQEKANNQQMFDYLDKNYEQQHAELLKFAKGTPSPKFVNYENFKGGKTSLDDFKGKYVYIDVWATWCGPCKREIPSLKKVEEKYHGKSIEFVSISVDNVDGRRGSYDNWKAMVKDKQLGGVQLFADNDFKSQFIRDYNINSIPRFLLIDPNGNIVDANTYRPSDPKLIDLFTELGI